MVQYVYHKECARDKPADRTATCLRKVLTLDRWVQEHAASIGSDGRIFYGYCEYERKKEL